MKQPIRFFSIGLFTASILLLVIYFLANKPEAEAIPIDEMIATVENDGYRVLTEDEFIQLSLNGEQDNNEQKDKEKKDKAKDTKKDSVKVSKKEDKQEDKKKTAEKKDEEKTSDVKKKQDKKEKKKKKKKEKVTYTLKIEEKMVSSDITERLVANKIIKNGDKFNKFLENNGYSTKVQLGEFKVNSDMDYEEIAQTITK